PREEDVPLNEIDEVGAGVCESTYEEKVNELSLKLIKTTTNKTKNTESNNDVGYTRGEIMVAIDLLQVYVPHARLQLLNSTKFGRQHCD
ncbi:unnamed protein product, partial [Sphenostylis stenocarpa]